MGPDLVTGATGFIGRHLVSRLRAQGRTVVALCRPGSEGKLRALGVPGPDERADAGAGGLDIVHGDLTDRSSLERAAHGAERIFHCAGEVADWGPIARFDEVNVRGARWLLEAARSGGAQRFVHTSSFVVFGVPSPAFLDDWTPYGPSRDPYARTKTAGEQTVLAFAAETGLACSVLRPTVVYGRGSTWLEEPIRMMKKGAFFLIGGGDGTCHPCYVDNLVDAMLLVAEQPAASGQAYLVSDDDPIPFRDYFGALASLCGAPLPRRSIPVAVARATAACLEAGYRATGATGRPLLTQTAIDLVTTRCSVSIRKIKEDLGYRPRVGFREAMEQLRRTRTR